MTTINVADIETFISVITSDTPIPENLKPLNSLYQQIKNKTVQQGKRITDLSEIGKPFYGSIKGISKRDFELMLNRLAMFEAMSNNKNWPKFSSKIPKSFGTQTPVIKNVCKQTFFSEKEKQFFSDQLRILGDQGEEILGEASYNLLPVT